MIDYVLYFWIFLAAQILPPGAEAKLHFERFNEGAISLRFKAGAKGEWTVTDKQGREAVVRIQGSKVQLGTRERAGDVVDVNSDFGLDGKSDFKKGGVFKCRKTGRDCARLAKVARGMYRLNFQWGDKDRVRRGIIFWEIK